MTILQTNASIRCGGGDGVGYDGGYDSCDGDAGGGICGVGGC